MAWIKRNLWFVVLSFVALVLIGVGVFYLVTQVSNESTAASAISDKYQELTKLNQLNPHPGNDQIDNIKNARAQEAALKAYLAKLTPLFQKIPAIPDNSGTSNKVSNSEFAAQLRNTVSELRRVAAQQSVILPQDYYFSFESQRKVMIFDPSGLEKLAVQLGEVKVLSEILFGAKVNSLDSLRRESVSTNDNNPSDYISEKTTVGTLADFAPYELTFRCFSSELAYVLSHLAGSTHGFIVKSISIESTGSIANDDNGGNPAGQPLPGQFAPRGAEGYPPGYRPQIPFGEGGATPPRAYAPAASPASASSAKGPQVFLTEKPFRVTLLVEVVKLKTAAK